MDYLQANFNSAFTLPVLPPFPIFTAFPTEITNTKDFYSVVVNKVIHRNAIMKSRTVYSQTASVTTENLAFDQLTGEALLTKTTNEFSDTLFMFNYPAYWIYEGMGPAYVNSKLKIDKDNFSEYKIFLKEGDELRGYVCSSSCLERPRFWVNEKLNLVDKDNQKVDNFSGEYQVYNSGYKNLINSSAGQVVTWNYNPIKNSNKISFDNIINSSAVEYFDEAVLYCESCATEKSTAIPTEGQNGRFEEDADMADINVDVISPIEMEKQTDNKIIDNSELISEQNNNIVEKASFFSRLFSAKAKITVEDNGKNIISVPESNNISVSYPEDNKDPYCKCDINAAKYGLNKYLSGEKGTWSQKRNWFYLTERTSGDINNSFTDIRTQGVYKDYQDFWILPVSDKWEINKENWEWQQKINLVAVDGLPIESENRIGIKTATLLGYNNTLVIAKADNAAYNEVFFDGFEDNYTENCKNTSQENLLLKRAFLINGELSVDNNNFHTGKYSLKVDNENFVFTIMPPDSACRDYNPNIAEKKKCSACVGGFNPEKNKEYVFSAWVRVDKPQPILDCSDASVVITDGYSNIGSFKSEGPVIEGWQRIEGVFKIPQNNNYIEIVLKKGNFITYFDDLRIFPTDANMVSHVYDKYNYRYTYSLDENNYFTKYEYNNEGQLIRIKKETERGIVTVQESNHGLRKNNNNE